MPLSRNLLVVTEKPRTAAVPAEMRIGLHPNVEPNCAVGLKEINPPSHSAGYTPGIELR
jgi:hypothetical protein